MRTYRQQLAREVRRWMLIPRARRVAREREWLELGEFLQAIRDSARKHPIPREPREYADS